MEICKMFRDRKTIFGRLTNAEWVYLFVFLALLLGKAFQHRLPMSDLKVYFRAGEHLLSGVSVFSSDGFFEFYRFKYPPTAAVMFIPLALLPSWLGKTFAAAILLLCLLAFMRILSTWTPHACNDRIRILILLGFGGMMQYEIHLGQITWAILLGLTAVPLKIEC
ncbi:MAG: DUF2029 domain-containing protein [Candidatus Riflebacteria bacterium]|nr:DUF2029 domain-containing protein [Candidatus Riflebacteria bacterium]